MNTQQKIIGTVVIIAIIIGAILVIKGVQKDSNSDSLPEGIKAEPTDIVSDFYQAWLEARKSTSTDPYAQNLQNSESLTPALRERLVDSEAAFRENGTDPVLCREPLPEKLRTRTIVKSDTDAQILVLGKIDISMTFSKATLAGRDGFWQITDLSCDVSEEAPDQGEFNFDKEGYLLKEHVPSPHDPQQWHLVFKQDDVDGHVVPLLLNEASVCINKSQENSCEESMLFEAAYVHLQGNMSEAGANVKRIEFID